MAVNLTPEQVAEMHARNLVDRAYSIRERYSALLDERKANRDALRTAVRSGLLSGDLADEVSELYPPRSTGRDMDADAEPIPAE